MPAPGPAVDQTGVCGDGEHTVRLTITDLCDNTDTADATVEVQYSPPVAIAQDYSANADDQCCITVHLSDIDGGTYDPDGAGDIKSFCITDVDGSDASCADSVVVCGQGLHYLTITVTDWCDSTSSAVAEVEVIDITPPDITVVLDRNALWPPNHKMVEVCSQITVTDNCDPDPEVALVSIESDEPDNDKGDGNTLGDIDGTDYLPRPRKWRRQKPRVRQSGGIRGGIRARRGSGSLKSRTMRRKSKAARSQPVK